MKRGFLLFLSIFSIQNLFAQANLDSSLIRELEEMVKIDQLAASNAQPPKEFSSLSQSEWESKKDSIFRANQEKASKILEEVGYPGFDKVGQVGERNFWLIVQHSDFNLAFQEEVLDLMHEEVLEGNASPSNYALLTDRVRMNKGEKLVYGTQVNYNFITGEAFSLPTEDPENLNARRAEMGLEPIEDYLAEMTEMHMEMNSMIGGITNAALVLFSVLMLVLVVMMYFFTRGKKPETQAL
ncbi:DUF6624 domain-containing protein [Algoriphagus sediminis]|uniref:Uncharacterized protein n=1 Tax=Algoriphagus sediminis TaxID=3057113 RepID=A0ABT7YC30_9BACT|nr:DUF6624 domain-containing protein [Algoriphagus sediminis]MDN3204069.1 hypothetical protein [Algoriphagus sediminis]